MFEIGTPLSTTATKVLFCGAGELGKEVIIEMMRLGVEVVAVDRYANPPGLQVGPPSSVLNISDGACLWACSLLTVLMLSTCSTAWPFAR